MIGQAISEYLYEVESLGRYTVSLNELRNRFGRENDKAIAQKLHRLKKEGKLIQIHQEFYAIVSAQFAKLGTLPTIYFIDDLMKFLQREYYLALFSAAAFQGAGHQQPMLSQVIIQKPAIRSKKNEKQNIKFYTRNHWDKKWLDIKKTDAGYVMVSSKELTVIDLVQYHKQIGGLNRTLPILEELLEEVKTQKLLSIASQTPLPTLQRLGCIFDFLEEEKLANILWNWLSKKKTNISPLSLLHKEKPGNLNERWRLTLNTDLTL